MSVPVIKPASSLHKNAASAPISFGWPQRPIGILDRNMAFFSASCVIGKFISVKNGPGEIPTTVIPSGANSNAKLFVSPSSAAFVEEYAVLSGKLTCAMIDVMLKIRP
jgi:hypothetical protein